METDFCKHITTKKLMAIQQLFKKWDVSVAKPLGLSKNQKNQCIHGNYAYVLLNNIMCALILDEYDQIGILKMYFSVLSINTESWQKGILKEKFEVLRILFFILSVQSHTFNNQIKMALYLTFKCIFEKQKLIIGTTRTYIIISQPLQCCILQNKNTIGSINYNLYQVQI